MKQKINFLLAILGIIFFSGCIQESAPAFKEGIIPASEISMCEQNYVLDDEHKLIPDRQTHPEDLQIVQKFTFTKECSSGVEEIWVREPEPISDPIYEKVLYCRAENKFLVVKGLGIRGAEFYLYDGKPCK